MVVVKERHMTFRDRNIVVVGLARSGAGAANLLCTLGARVTVTDSKPRNALEDSIRKLLPSVKIVTNGNPPDIFASADMIVISPGVPATIPPLAQAIANGVPVIGELELAYQVVRSEYAEISANVPFIGITGTNGKSTTTTLADLMLKQAGFRTLLGGNIGNALTEEVLKFVGAGPRSASSLPDLIVAEVSSFQLESVRDFRPRVAAILNITPDHLDRYRDMDEYVGAKARIFENQNSDDLLVLNADDPEVIKAEREKLNVKSSRPRVVYFSRKREMTGAFFRDGSISFDLPELGISPSSFTIHASEIRIQGIHNIENAMAASLVSLLSGCSPESVSEALRSFPGLEHRLEFAGEIRGVRFINDSKGTNVGAVLKSLEGFDNVVLIMGGLDKGSDFTVLRDLVRRRVKALVLIGKARYKIEEALGSFADTVMADDLGSAVRLSLERASAGDTVLLSPGCASFDMFRDFEDRGRRFKDAVRAAMNEQ